MKKKRVDKLYVNERIMFARKGITLMSLVITIIILLILAGISISMLIGDQGIIRKAQEAAKNYEEAAKVEDEQLAKLYKMIENPEDYDPDEIIGETDKVIKDLQDQINNLNTILAQTNATANQILTGKKAYSEGSLLTGTMPNRGEVSQTLSAGENYTIPEGYHNGSGKITAKDLASQTQATATENDIVVGKTAWVNGNKITGSTTGVYNMAGWLGWTEYYNQLVSQGERWTIRSLDVDPRYTYIFIYSGVHYTERTGFETGIKVEDNDPALYQVYGTKFAIYKPKTNKTVTYGGASKVNKDSHIMKMMHIVRLGG